MEKRSYDTDLNSKQWELVSSVLTSCKPNKGRGRPQGINLLEVFNAIFFRCADRLPVAYVAT